MNSYAFPDHIVISENAKNLINRILNLDPAKRPNIDQILDHPFLSNHSVPKILPLSTLALPPTEAFKKYLIKNKINKFFFF